MESNQNDIAVLNMKSLVSTYTCLYPFCCENKFLIGTIYVE